MHAYIHYIGTAVPSHKISQTKIADFMSNALGMSEEEKHHLDVLYRATGIHSRHSVIKDYGNEPDQNTFFPKNRSLEPFPDISARMRVYEKESLKLSLKAIENTLPVNFERKSVTHLITVSCTGMYAPGLDIELVKKLQFNTSVKRTAINFMGCYGAFNAFKLADSICRADSASNVLIVAVELCTLHFQKDKEEDTLLSNALFSDGAAAVLVSGRQQEKSMMMKGFHSDLAYDGKQEMAWQIGNHGFEMKLTSLVPEIIEKNIGVLTENLLDSLKLKLEDVSMYAIHPGGKKILEVIEKQLQIPREKNTPAHQVLREYGNMSSPTILFVLKDIFSQIEKEDAGENLLSFAFGPGLTLESMLLEIC